MANVISGTYSFLDVQAAFVGGGFSFDLKGSGLGSEGIKITMNDDKDAMVIGAAGDGMHSLRASRSGRVTITLLKTGPGNAMMNQVYNYESLSSAFWGQNQITITNPVSGDNITCQDGAFLKQPEITYSTDGAMNVWEFNFVQIDQILGNNFQATGL